MNVRRNPQTSVVLDPTARRQLEAIMERHNLASISVAIKFCIAGAFYELTRDEAAAQGGRRASDKDN